MSPLDLVRAVAREYPTPFGITLLLALFAFVLLLAITTDPARYRKDPS